MSAVVVLGSINEDLLLRVPRAPLPGETLLGRSSSRLPGGKGANQAVAAARLGAEVAMIGAVGQDDAGSRQLENLTANQVDSTAVTCERAETGLAVVSVTDNGENSIIVTSGANGEVGQQHVEALGSLVREGDIFVAQLELPSDVVAAALDVARSQRARTILNAAPMTDLSNLIESVDILVVNETEAQELYGGTRNDAPDPLTMAKHLAERLDVEVVMTLGARGAAMVGRSEVWKVPGRAVDVSDTTGAGDTFVGALAAALAAGLEPERALRSANVAASLACTAAGAQSAMPHLADLAADAPWIAKEH